MKKSLIVLTALLLMNSTVVWADDFSGIDGITADQRQKLSRIHFKYKTENNNLEQKIIEYNSMIINLKNSSILSPLINSCLLKNSSGDNKSPSDIAKLTEAYQKNIDTLKEEQKKLEEETKSLYKAVFTEEQYKQYEAQKVKTENAFNNFLQK